MSIHPFYQGTSEEELKELFDEIQENLPDLMIDELAFDEG
jgi:hypothetical protein